MQLEGCIESTPAVFQGRIFVGDRANNRIQIIDQQGNFLASWTQFGRPSGIYIDENDIIYVADSESSPAPDPHLGMRNAGWEKGIRVGDARTGWVHYFVPDTQADVTGYSGPEGIAVDAEGNLYGAEVTQRRTVVRGGERFTFYGGATIILGPDGDFRYIIGKGVRNHRREEAQWKYMRHQGEAYWRLAGGEWRPEPRPFRVVHEGRGEVGGRR